MTDPTLDTLTTRLDRLERRIKCWKLSGIVCGIAITGALLIGATSPPPSELVTRSLRVVDSQGRPAIILAAVEDRPFVALLHEGKLRAALNGAADRTSFELYAADGRNSRVELRVDESDNPVLLMTDPHNVIRVQMVVAKDGKPNMKLFDERKRPRAIWSMNDEGESALLLLDRGGNPLGGVVPKGH